MKDCKFVNRYGHIEVYCDGKLLFTADNWKEAVEELEEMRGETA